MHESLSTRLERVLRVVPHFPKPGIRFRDITPLLADSQLMLEVIAAMKAPLSTRDISHVVGIESRGFLFGVPIAMALGASFVPARKPGKLPAASLRESFSLEYGSDALEIHVDAFHPNSRVVVVDDILATGGTLAAACRLIERLGATIVAISVLGEIEGLRDPSVLAGREVHTLVTL